MLRWIALWTVLWAWQAQLAWAQDLWKLGGQGGRSWAETAALNVMGDETSAPGALQPWELRPDVNFLPLVSQRFSWDRWQFPLDPFWTEGIPSALAGAWQQSVRPAVPAHLHVRRRRSPDLQLEHQLRPRRQQD